jgi:hypothetical protein
MVLPLLPYAVPYAAPSVAAAAATPTYNLAGKEDARERRGQATTNLMYSNPITAPLMLIPGVRGEVRRFGRGAGEDPFQYNPGNQAAMPFIQKYGGAVNDAYMQNQGISVAELQQLVVQQEEAAVRKAQEDQINAYFADPVRAQSFARQYDAELAQSKDMLGRNTQATMRQQAQRQAMRGTMGGSTDVENRANIAGGYQSTLADLAARRNQAGQMQQMADVGEKTSLLGIVNETDPFSRQRAQAGLTGLRGQGAAAEGYISAGLSDMRARQTGDNLQSEAIGSGLSGFARGLGTYGDRRTRAGYSSLWGG